MSIENIVIPEMYIPENGGMIRYRIEYASMTAQRSGPHWRITPATRTITLYNCQNMEDILEKLLDAYINIHQGSRIV